MHMTRLMFSEKRTNVQKQFQETGNRLTREVNDFNNASKSLLLRGENNPCIYLRIAYKFKADIRHIFLGTYG